MFLSSSICLLKPCEFITLFVTWGFFVCKADRCFLQMHMLDMWELETIILELFHTAMINAPLLHSKMFMVIYNNRTTS